MSMVSSVEKGKAGSLVRMAEKLEKLVHEAAEQGQPLHSTERKILDSVLEIGFTAVDQLIGLQGDGDLGETVETETGRTLYRSAEPVERPLRTIFGEHAIRVYAYSPGVNKKIELRPVDARLQLPPGRCSYLFEEFSQYFCVDQAFGQASAGIDTVFGQKISTDTLESINVRMGDQAEEFLNDLPTPPAEEEGELLVLSADGKGVPLVRKDAQKLPVFDKPERPGNRRMATVAAVYSVDRHVRTPEQVVAALFRDKRGKPAKDRPRPQFKHVTARFPKAYEDGERTVKSTGPTEAFCWAAEEVASRRQAGQSLIRVMDGQPSLWDTGDLCLGVPSEEMIDILDILHVSSYVWRAAKVFYRHREYQEAFARDKLLRILEGDVRNVIAGLRRRATRQKLAGDARKEIDTVCGYFSTNADRMKYDEYLRKGYPIASGVIEGACRHLVKDRMERSGMRWRLAGAQAMLHVRAVHQSSYWENFHRQRIKSEQPLIHPHRSLLDDYKPEPLNA